MPRSISSTLVGSIAAVALLAGCGGSSGSSSSAPASGAPASSVPAGASGSPGSALSGDARSAATGDIPDNQVFLVFRNPGAGYSLKYPEGWTQSGASGSVTFRDKNNLVHVEVARRRAPSVSAVSAQLAALKRANATLGFTPPVSVTLGSEKAIKAVYTTQSAPSPVTGKRVKLIVDRYVVAGAGRVATVDLGTPRGVDNVDAYRLMIESFRWH
jgi:hypothetical protein